MFMHLICFYCGLTLKKLESYDVVFSCLQATPSFSMLPASKVGDIKVKDPTSTTES